MEPLSVSQGAHRQQSLPCSRGPGCAHLVIVFVDILVEFMQSHARPKVTRVVLGKRANKRGEK